MNPKEVANGYECPMGCGHVAPTVWDLYGHLNRKHPAGKKKGGQHRGKEVNMPQKKCDKCGETVQAHAVPLKHGVFRIVNGQFKVEECSGTFKEVSA